MSPKTVTGEELPLDDGPAQDSELSRSSQQPFTPPIRTDRQDWRPLRFLGHFKKFTQHTVRHALIGVELQARQELGADIRVLPICVIDRIAYVVVRPVTRARDTLTEMIKGSLKLAAHRPVAH